MTGLLHKYRALFHLVAWVVGVAAGALLTKPLIGIPIVAVGGTLYFTAIKIDERRHPGPTPELIKSMTEGMLKASTHSNLNCVESVSIWRPSRRGDLELWVSEFISVPPLGGIKVRPPDPSCALWKAHDSRKACLVTSGIDQITFARFAVPFTDSIDRVKIIGILCFETSSVKGEEDLRVNGLWRQAEDLCATLGPAISYLQD